MRRISQRGGFILVVALFVAALIAGAVIFCAALIRHGDAAPQRALSLARAQALYGLDVALAQLQSAASADTTATASAKILYDTLPNGNWAGAWPQGENTPVWLVSGSGGDPRIQENTVVTADLRAPLVETPSGSYAYATEDLSQRVTVKPDRLSQLSPAYSDTSENFQQLLQRLSQETVFVPTTAGLADTQKTALSYGLLTDPLSGGFKKDLTTMDATADAEAAALKAWLDPAQFIKARPLIWPRVALLMGVYRDGAGVPQLGLAFWANAWNPYTQNLPFDSRGNFDLRLRLTGPAITLRFLDATGAQIGAPLTLSLTAHTLGDPILTDVYGPMKAGEVRFITQYRMLPISSFAYDTAKTVEVTIGDGGWSFVFETLSGDPIQTLSGFSTTRVTKSFGYNVLSESQFENNGTPNLAQWLFTFQLREPIDAMLASADPRAPHVAFSSAYYSMNANLFDAQRNFSRDAFISSGRYHDQANEVRFDLPADYCPSLGPFRQMAFDGVPTLSFGGAEAFAANTFLDRYFLSTLPSDEAVWSPAQTRPLPNANLRLTGHPTLADLRASPASSLLLQGAFNLNTADPQAWASVLPRERYAYEFFVDSSNPPTSVSDAERAAWASAIAAKLRSRGAPWHSLSEFAADNAAGVLLPPDVFCRTSALLQPRGDTFLIHLWAQSSGAVASADALVQRLPASATGRKFQLLSLTWTAPPAQD